MSKRTVFYALSVFFVGVLVYLCSLYRRERRVRAFLSSGSWDLLQKRVDRMRGAKAQTTEVLRNYLAPALRAWSDEALSNLDTAESGRASLVP